MIWSRKPALSRDRQVTLAGRGTLTLSQTDHIATGGEGSVFRKSGTAIKLYTDPKEMHRRGLDRKIALLGAIHHPYIVAPKGLVLDTSGKPLGYWMAFAEGEMLPRLFTNDFRSRIGFGDRETSVLAERMREAVRVVHGHGAVMVDGNELNYLAWLGGSDGPEPRLIDVDSWAIGAFGAKVIMPSIRDWHAKDFDQTTDWFAWAIVTFQLYTGSHPYKGTAEGFARTDLEARMRANVSVFHDGVRVNRAVRDPATIPAALRAWYERVFEAGERSAPPSPFDTTRVAQRGKVLRQIVTSHQGGLVFEKIFERAGDAVSRVFPCGVVRLASGALHEVGGRRITATNTIDVEVVERDGGWLIAEACTFRFIARDGTAIALPSPIAGRQVVLASKRLFMISADALSEIEFKLIGGKPLLAPGRAWRLSANAMRWFDGLGVLDALGSSWLIVPFGDASCAQLRVPELDGIIPVAGTAGRQFAIIVGRDAHGTYRRYAIACDTEHRTYRISADETDTPEINAAMLPRGVCASIIADGELQVLVPSTGESKVVADRGISTGMQLSAMGERVVHLDNGALWGVRMS